MRAGRLRQRITLQTRAETSNSYGEGEPAWSDFATVYASVEPIRGRELENARATQSETTHRINLRYYPGLFPTMRVKLGTRLFRVEEILNLEERDREIQLMCVEVLTG